MLLFANCGLETIYYLREPSIGKEVHYDNVDRRLDYFYFITGNNRNLEGSDFSYKGTEIYYKIFNNKSALSSSYNSINSTLSSSDISAAANMLINTKKYRPLISDRTRETPLITSHSTAFEIRLNKYFDNPSHIMEVGTGAVIGLPRRNFSSGNKLYGFEFSNDDRDNNPLPTSKDEDVEWSSSSSESGCWYVDVWAFSTGRDNSYTWSYSKALHLGSITIRESEYKK